MRSHASDKQCGAFFVLTPPSFAFYSVAKAYATFCVMGPLGLNRPSAKLAGGLKESQEAHFEHFDCLGPDMVRMGPGRFTFSTLTAWAQIWPE